MPWITINFDLTLRSNALMDCTGFQSLGLVMDALDYNQLSLRCGIERSDVTYWMAVAWITEGCLGLQSTLT